MRVKISYPHPLKKKFIPIINVIITSLSLSTCQMPQKLYFKYFMCFITLYLKIVMN